MESVSVKEKQRKELESLERRGVLKAEDVVEFAKNPKTALHSAFQWDNTKAAHEYRLIQARNLIVSVRLIHKTSPDEVVQCYVSLKDDRYNGKGGGYRPLIKVLSNKEQRQALLEAAFEDFNYWKEKYKTLTELAPIFEVAERLAKRKKAVKARKALAKTV